MSILNFLKSSNVAEVTVTKKGGGGVRKQWNPPVGIVALRVWADGSVFPSQAAVKQFDLEYRNATIGKEAIALKEGETEQKYRKTYDFPNGTGNGFDFIDSRDWNQIKDAEGAMLFISPVPKNAGKVDLFNTVAYEEDGTPKISVMDQGAATFGQQVLIPALQEVYGIKFNQDAVEAAEGVEAQEAITDGVDFVDLVICESIGEFNITEKYSKPITFAPKRVTRGADKGKADYVRRENVKIYGFIPAADVLPDYAPDEKKTESGSDSGSEA